MAMAIALIAMSAVGVSAASAEFIPNLYPAEVEGEASESLWLYNTAEFGCVGEDVQDGYIEEPGVAETLSTSLHDATSCTSGLQVEMNGCGFTFRVGSEVGEDEYEGSMDLANAPGKTCTGIVLRDKNYWSSNCYTVIYPTDNEQYGTEATLKEVASSPRTFTVDGRTVFKAHKVGTGGFCPNSELVYSNEWLMKAYEAGPPPGSQIGISLEEDPPPPPPVPNFSFSEGFSGDVDLFNPLVLTTNTGQVITCWSVPLGGSHESENVELDVSSTGTATCEAHIGTAYLITDGKFNSCYLHFHLETFTSGEVSGLCANEGDTFDAVIYANQAKYEAHEGLCEIHVALQSVGATPATFSGGQVGAEFAREGMTASRTGSILCGKPTAAELAGGIELEGVAIE